jgi:hypothetical protein
MTKVAVVYHSGYGHTARQARSVVAGAAGVPDVEAVPVAFRPRPTWRRPGSSAAGWVKWR